MRHHKVLFCRQIGPADDYALSGHWTGADALLSVWQTEEDRALTLRPHSLRHLQNTELFRLGIADTIITKRFNRRQVAQSYEYDHRSLSEDLDQVELKPEVEDRLGEKSATILRLMKSGKARGPIVEAFKRIQLTDGEDAAIEYLVVEGGRLIEERKLQKLGNGEHKLLDAETASADGLSGTLQVATKSIQSRITGSIGLDNQLAHSKVGLEGVRKLLATAPGQLVFPDGPDLSHDLAKPKGRVLDGQY
jgi:hypothetical protein